MSVFAIMNHWWLDHHICHDRLPRSEKSGKLLQIHREIAHWTYSPRTASAHMAVPLVAERLDDPICRRFTLIRNRGVRFAQTGAKYWGFADGGVGLGNR